MRARLQGLARPGHRRSAEIQEANNEWREHDDPLKEFLEDCCEVEEKAYCRSSELTSAYAWWCSDTNERFPLGREAFGERIRNKGFTANRSRRDDDGKQLRTIEGLRIRPDVVTKMSEAKTGSKRQSWFDK